MDKRKRADVRGRANTKVPARFTKMECRYLRMAAETNHPDFIDLCDEDRIAVALRFSKFMTFEEIALWRGYCAPKACKHAMRGARTLLKAARS